MPFLFKTPQFFGKPKLYLHLIDLWLKDIMKRNHERYMYILTVFKI